MAKNNFQSAREIKLESEQIDNKNVTIRVGASANKTSPDTIFIVASFWIRPKKKFLKKEGKELKNILKKEIQSIYTEQLRPKLSNHTLFPFEKDNLFIKNIPENVNYNSKKNYISIELFLHTKNIISKDKLPLCDETDTTLLNECITIANDMCNSSILSGNSLFEIYKSS